MPINGKGWELHVVRLGWHVRQKSKADMLARACADERTYGTYQVYRNGKEVKDLRGNICESFGKGNKIENSGHRILQGRYQLSTHYLRDGHYQTIGYSENTNPPMPAILLNEKQNHPFSTYPRYGVLIHPGHPPCLYLSAVGCLNPTSELGASEEMEFSDSRSRVIALIDDLKRFAPPAFVKKRKKL
jgi:hypothetical protein